MIIRVDYVRKELECMHDHVADNANTTINELSFLVKQIKFFSYTYNSIQPPFQSYFD